ncbi:MAG: DNA mismatch repair protein MutS [Verrucomicrobiota bacterium]
MSKKLTPMMEQYRRIKSELPSDALLLFRLGDFYEMFFEDAKLGAELLNLTLTKRNDTPMCGVPHHAAESYIGKLVQAGRRVAICDQISEPKPGQVVERAVTRIFSPGNVIDLDLTQPKENRFLACIYQDSKHNGFAYLDMSTGEFRLTETPDSRGMHDELLRLQPKEIIYASESEELHLPDGFTATLTPYDDWVFDLEFANSKLCDHFKTQSLDGFGCQNMEAAITAAGALLHYVTECLRGSSSHILNLRPYLTHDYLILDAVTQRNLELTRQAGIAASDTSLLKAIDHTITAMGGRELRNWLLHALRDKPAIEARQLTIQRWLEDVARLESFRENLQSVRDIERLISRFAQGSGNARDLHALRQSLEQIPLLQNTAKSLECALADSLAEELTPQPSLITLINEAIHPEPPLSLKEGHLIREGYHEDVDQLRTATREGKAWIAKFQAEEQESTGIKSLKVRFNQVFGYYIEITKTHLEAVPAHYIRKQTMANAERFITPDLKEIESKILGAEERIKHLEYELFLEVREQVIAVTATIQKTAHAISRLDVLASLATLAHLYNYRCPKISTNGRLEIKEGRHPVLEQISSADKFVPNDSLLDDDTQRLIILTGPNMAGKSTYIRQVALIALLAHTGSYVPANSATVPLLDRIFTRVGASDDLSRGQSTFMVEMNETANILNNATENSLVILDEIGRGTSTFDGLSIAWSVAEHLHNEIKARTLFATHYHELTELSLLLSGAKNYNVAVREWHDQIIFLRKIVPGSADKSYGIQVARLAGLPKTVLDRAKDILRNLEEGALDVTGRPHLVSNNSHTISESESTEENQGTKKPKALNRGKGYPQLDLFKQ